MNAAPDVKPLGVWDTSDPDSAYHSHVSEASAWSRRHLPDGGGDVGRAEFHDGPPRAVITRFARDAHGKLHDRIAGKPVLLAPVTIPLDELPPAHLLAI